MNIRPSTLPRDLAQSVIGLPDDVLAALVPLDAQSVSRTFRQGDDLVIVLRTGGRIEIEGFFAVEDRVLVLRDPAAGDLLEARLDEDGALIGLEPRALSDLAAMFGATPQDVDALEAVYEAGPVAGPDGTSGGDYLTLSTSGAVGSAAIPPAAIFAGIAAIGAIAVAASDDDDMGGETDPAAAALGVISAHAAADGGGTAPSVADYTAAGVTGVTDANLAAVNAAVAAVDGTDADSTSEVQALATGAIDALKPVNPDAGGGTEGGETGGGDSGGDGDTGDGDTDGDPDAGGDPDGGDGDAGGDPDGSETGGGTDGSETGGAGTGGGTEGGQPDTDGGDPDTDGGTDGVDPVDPAATALGVITAYAAADGQGDDLVVPTVDTYTAAGVTGVTAANLAAVNAAVAAVAREAADSTAEVQTLADGAIDALKPVNPDAGGGAEGGETGGGDGGDGDAGGDPDGSETGGGTEGGDPDTGGPDPAVPDPAAAALGVISTYADGGGTAPTVETYADAGVTGVTESNLAAVNAVLALADREAVDETSEVQGLVDGVIADLADAARRTALSELQFHAEFSGGAGTDPSLETYADAGVTGVTQDNLAAVNAAIASASGLPAVRAAIAAADGDPDAAADPDFAAAVAEIQTLADGAIAAGVIADWAADSTEPSLAPSLETYTTAGVTGVTESNLAAVNAVLALAEREAADETSEVQGLVDGVIADLADAARRTALSELQFHAEFSGGAGTDPSLETYADAGVTGVTQDNLAAVNAAIASASGLPAVRAAIAAADGDPDAAAEPDFAAAVAEIQTLADGAIAAGVIADWAADSTEPSLAPSLETYTTAGVTGVTESNLAAVNAVLALADREAVDETSEVQGLVDGVIADLADAARRTALSELQFHAEFSGGAGTDPSLETYADAGVTGVTQDNLAAVNAAIASASGLPAVRAAIAAADGDPDAAAEPDFAAAVAEIQTLADGAIAAGVIADWAADSTEPSLAPSLETYTTAGVTGVTESNLAAVNAVLALADREAVDETSEVQGLVDGVIADLADAARRTALSELQFHAEFSGGAGTDPSLETYADAGVTGVTQDNLAAVNAAIASASGLPAVRAAIAAADGDPDAAADPDFAAAVAEIQTLADGAIAAGVIADWAADSTEPSLAPSLETYTTAGVTGVTESNLAAVNAVLALAEREAADETSEVQGLVDGVIADLADAARRTALSELQFHAEFSGGAGTDPSLETYADAGVTGVTQDNLAAVNAAIASASGLPAVRAAIAAADGDPDAAADPDFAAAVAEIQTLVDPAIAAEAATMAALEIISAWAEDSDANPAPLVADYANAGVTEVTAANLAAVNMAVAAVARESADETSEVQGLVDGVIAAVAASLSTIAEHAADSANPEPTIADYQAVLGLGIGVTEANLAAVNTAVAAVAREAADTADEVFGLVQNAVADAALDVIADYAADATNTTPTVADYQAVVGLGIGVTEANLAAVNAAVAAVAREAADTADEVFALAQVAVAADAALGIIANYAVDSANPAPTVVDYEAALNVVDLVTAANLSAVNAAVAAVARESADTVDEILGLVQDAVSAFSVGIIANYAADSANPAPTVADYGYALDDFSLVTAANLAAVNTAIAAVAREAADTVDEILGLVQDAVAGAALDVIADYAADEANTAPTVADYGYALDDFSLVTAANLAAVNAAVAAVAREAADTVEEIADIVTDAVSAFSVGIIANYATDSANPAPTVADYGYALDDFSLVTAANLAAVNTAIAAVAREAADTVEEIAGIVTDAVADAALDVISDYAASDGADPAPTVADYGYALNDFSLVTEANLADVNAAIAAVAREAADTVEEVFGLVRGVVAAPAIEVIANYAASDGADPAPRVADYEDALYLFGLVTEANLADVNAAIAAVAREAADTVEEVFGLVRGVVAGPALEVLANYAADSDANTAPTVDTYVDAGVAGVTAANLAAVNAVLALAEREAADETSEVQGLVDGVIADLADAARRTALSELQFHAEFSGGAGTDPSLETYADAGVTGVTQDNLAAVNAAIASASGLPAVRAAIAAADGDPDAAADPDFAAAVAEIQTLADGAIAAGVIADWAADSTEPSLAPSLETYTTAGVTGVTAANLAAVNAVLALAEREAADETSEVQGLVDGVIADLADAARRTALSELQFHAEFSGGAGTDPSLETYADAGVTGVTQDNLAAVNAAIASASGLPAVRAAIAAADGDPDAAAEPDFAVAAAEIQALADPAIAALVSIVGWAGDSTDTTQAPSVADYANAGVTEVTAANVSAVNAAIAELGADAVDSVAKLQAIQAFTNGDDFVDEANSGDDTLLGLGGDDVLLGRGGNDRLLGGQGFDVLEGGPGADVLDGGDDLDTASYESSPAGVTVDLSTGSASGGDAEGDSLSNIEDVTGSDHSDTLTGDDGENLLDGRGGDDTLTGGEGDDTFYFDSISAGGDDVIEDFDTDGDTLFFFNDGGEALFADLEALRAALTEDGDDLVIDLPDEAGSITLRNVENDDAFEASVEFINFEPDTSVGV